MVWGPESAETFVSMIPPHISDELVTIDILRRQLELFEHKMIGVLHRELRLQTRTLMLGLVGSMATMTSLCLAAITLTT